MSPTSRKNGVVGLLAAALALAGPSHVAAVCPNDLCECLGEAANFRVVSADKMTVGSGNVVSSYYPFMIGTFVLDNVEANVCGGTTALLTEPGRDYTEIEGDLYVLEGPGRTAIRGRILGPESYPGQTSVVGAKNIATGGGSIVGPVAAINTIDTTGTHPGLTRCAQAIADIQSASQTFAGLTPTQTLGAVIFDDGEQHDIAVGPGVNVLSASKLIVKPKKVSRSYLRGTTLQLTLDPATESVIINASSLYVGRNCGIVVFGDPTKVVINIVGPGAGPSSGQDAYVAPAILAPERMVRIGPRGDARAVYGKKVLLRGPYVSQAYNACPFTPLP